MHNRLREAENRRQIVAERLATRKRRILFNGTNPHYLAASLRFSTPRVLFEGGFLPCTPTITLTDRT